MFYGNIFITKQKEDLLCPTINVMYHHIPLILVHLDSIQEKKSVRPTFSAERIFGGSLLAMCSNDFVCFYDWAECRLIRRIDVNVKVGVLFPAYGA